MYRTLRHRSVRRSFMSGLGIHILAAADQVIQSLHGLFRRCAIVVSVDLENVDVVRSETPE